MIKALSIHFSHPFPGMEKGKKYLALLRKSAQPGNLTINQKTKLYAIFAHTKNFFALTLFYQIV